MVSIKSLLQLQHYFRLQQRTVGEEQNAAQLAKAARGAFHNRLIRRKRAAYEKKAQLNRFGLLACRIIYNSLTLAHTHQLNDSTIFAGNDRPHTI
jgi:hypothetical protein